MDAIYGGFMRVLNVLERDGLKYSNGLAMKVSIVDNNDPLISHLYDVMEDGIDDSPKIYIRCGAKSNIYSIVRFGQNAIEIKSNANLIVDKKSAENAKQYYDDLNTNIFLGQIHIIHDNVYHLAKFNYDCFNSVENIYMYIADTMLSAYSAIDCKVLIFPDK